MAQHADKYDAAISVYTAYNDLHRNARKYQIDLQAPENTSHFYFHHYYITTLLIHKILHYTPMVSDAMEICYIIILAFTRPKDGQVVGPLNWTQEHKSI